MQMKRSEFLNRLEEALQGEVSAQVTRSNLDYYDSYITEEIRKGRSEKDVLEELGDPRLIARTIFDSQEAAAGTYGEERYAYNESPVREERQTESVQDLSGTVTDLWVKIKPTLIIAAVVIVGLTAVSALFSLAFKILLSPVFWVALGIWGLWRVFLR